MIKRFAVLLMLLYGILSNTTLAQSCYTTSMTDPVPFMGNTPELVRLMDGTIWKTSDFSYLYLYAYYPSVTVCPSTGTLTVGTHTFNVTAKSTVVYAALTYDGIYQWSAGNYLSLHQDGTHMIATIYFTNDVTSSFPAPSGGGVLPVPTLDLFDLMGGQVTGSTVRMSGTRFHRVCNVVYDFTFNSDASITVARFSVSNSTAADSAGISCSAIVGAEASTLIVPKIRFN